MNENKIMLSLFDHSTVMAKPWANAGYQCFCVDLQHPDGETKDGNIIKLGIDILKWIPTRMIDPEYVAFVAAFPPCTDVAVSGARWFKEKGINKLIEALRLFEACINITEEMAAPYMIENPVSTISKYYRQPDYSFHPFEYGDPWTKKTCLWVGNGFKMPLKRPVVPTQKDKIHRMAPSPERANERSKTPPGFAQRVFEANHKGEKMTVTCFGCGLMFDSYGNPVCPGCRVKITIRNSDEANDHYEEMEDGDEDSSDQS